MCTVLLPPGDNPTAVNKYIISYHKGLSGPQNTAHSFVEQENLFHRPGFQLRVVQALA